MKTIAQAFLLTTFCLACCLAVNAQRITFEMLKGTWEVKGSRDLKIFGDKTLRFNNINSQCYLKSDWTFDSDSTGFISLRPSDKCPDAQTAKFTFRLFESPGYGGPVYKMDVRFENGYTDKLSLQSEDGQKKLMMGYNQAVESTATDNRVWIYFSFKKKN